ncbi:MAG: hypothetical protein ACRD6X_08615 [Pyrinomonadaceae bacterium]
MIVYNESVMETTVSQMSVGELRKLISDVVEEKLAQYADPDAGLEPRDEIKELLIRQRESFNSGEDRGVPAEQVYRELGLE